MSSEYDFLDDFFAEGIIKTSPPSSVCSDTKLLDSSITPNLNPVQIDKLKRDNLKLRSRIKLYSKTLDQHKSRLTQLLTEKLALREEQRKYADFGKKLEEANLCVQATVQLNKQLQELSKSHDKEKDEWEEKQTKLQEHIKELKKSLADCRRKEDGIKKRRKKYLKALVELSEELMKIESFPKKYKRFYSSWKKQLEDAADEDSSFDIDDRSENQEKLPVSVEFLSPQSSTPKKLAHNGRAATLAVMSESEISDDDTTASPGKIKFAHSPRKSILKKLDNSPLSSPKVKLDAQDICVEKELGRKVVRNGSKDSIEKNDSVKTDAVVVEVTSNKTSLSLPMVEEERISAVGQESATGNDVCDVEEAGGSNNSSFSDLLEENGLEIEKNLMGLEETAEKSDMQRSSDSESLQCIMDEMIMSLSILQPFDDPKIYDRKPEEDTTCNQIVCSSPVNVRDLSTPVGTSEIIGNVSEDEDDNSSPMDDWEILPSVGEEAVIEVATGSKEVIQEKLSVVSESGNKNLDAVNNGVSINCNSEITSEGVDNDFTSIRTLNKYSVKHDKPRLMDSLSVNEKEAEVGKKENNACKLQTKADSACDIGRIVESNADTNPPFSDLDHIPDSGFNSPESPIAEIGELNVLFEKDHCSNSCVTETLRDLVSLRGSVLSLDDAIKHSCSSEVTVATAEKMPKILPASGKRTLDINNCIESISSSTEKATKSPEEEKSPLKQQACILNENQNSVSKIRRNRRLVKEAKEDSLLSVIKTRSQSVTREVNVSPKATRVKEVTSSPKVKNIKSDEVTESGRRKRNRKGKTSDEDNSLSDTSFQNLEGEDRAKSPEDRVKNLDNGSIKGKECLMMQKETHAIFNTNNKETGVNCKVLLAEKERTASVDFCNPKSLLQSVGKTKFYSEKTDSVVSSPEDGRLSVSDMAKINERSSEFGENASSTSDNILSLSEDDENDVYLQKSFGNNDLTSIGSKKCTNSNMNGHLNSVASDKIDLNSTNNLRSSYPQISNIMEKEVNSSAKQDISPKRNDSEKEYSNVNRQMECQMEGLKTSRAEAASLSIPNFNELTVECSTPISKYAGFRKDLKEAFKLFLDVLNPQVPKSDIKNVSLTLSEMNSSKKDSNKNSVGSTEEMNSDKDMSKSLQIFKEAEGDLDSSIHYPFSAKHLSFLRKPYSYPMKSLVGESQKPKSTILVRCDYKNSSKCVNDMKSNDSGKMLEDESTLMKTSNMLNSSFPCQFTAQKSQKRDKDKNVQKMKSPSSAGKPKLNFNVIRRPIVPFFFGSHSVNTIFKVKFWIGGHFSLESFPDVYSCPKSSVAGFGHGDLKGLAPVRNTNSASTLPPKFIGVKYSKKGTLASFSFVDQYLLPNKPLLNLFSKKPNFSAFAVESDDSSPTGNHGTCVMESTTDESKKDSSPHFVDQFYEESELLKESGINLNFKADANAAVEENADCSANGQENFDTSGKLEYVVTSSKQENATFSANRHENHEKSKYVNCPTNGHENVDRSKGVNPANLKLSSIQENTNCTKNRPVNVDRSETFSPTSRHENVDGSKDVNSANLKPTSIQENTNCTKSGPVIVDGSETFSPASSVSSSTQENANCAANGHDSLDGSENSNAAANVVFTAVLDDHPPLNLQSSDSKGVNFMSETQDPINDLAEIELDFSLLEPQFSREDIEKSPKELPEMDTGTMSGSYCHGGTSSVSPSISLMDTAHKEVNMEEIHRSDDSPPEVSIPKRMEIVRQDSHNINLSSVSSSEEGKREGPKVISKVEDQSPSLKKHRLPLIIQRRASVTPIKKTKSCVNATSGKVEKSEALEFSNNLALVGSSAMLTDGGVGAHAILSKEETCLSKRKLQDIMESNGEPLEKKAVSKPIEEHALSGSVEISFDGINCNIETPQFIENSFKPINTPKEIIKSASLCGTQSDSDDGELTIELGQVSDDLVTEIGHQEVDEHLSEIGSSPTSDALLDCRLLLHGDEKQSANEAIRSPTKIHKRRKLDNGGDEIDMESMHLSENENKGGKLPIKEKTELKDSNAKAQTETEFYENPPKKRRIAHSQKKNPVNLDCSSSLGDDSAVGQPVSVSTSLNATDSVSGVLLDNSVLILGEPEQLLSKMFGSLEVHGQGFKQNSLSKVRRKPRKQTFHRIRKGANLKHTPPPEEVYRMLFGDIEDELSEEDNTTTFTDPDNLCGDLNDSMDKLYEKTKKIRIAHTPKSRPEIKNEAQCTGGESSKSHLSEISKPFARKSILSHDNFNQKSKVKQSKLEKLRAQISKARGLFGRAVTDPKVPSTSNATADEITKCKVNTNEDVEEEKCDKSSKEKMNISKSVSNTKGEPFERIVGENRISNNLDEPKEGRVSTCEASSDEECKVTDEGKREMRKEADGPMDDKRKKRKNDLLGKEFEEVTSEEEVDMKIKKSLITRNRNAKKKIESDNQQSNTKESTVNGSDMESSSEVDSDSLVKQHEFISPNRCLKKKCALEDDLKSIQSSESEQDVISPRKTVVKKSYQEKKVEASTEGLDKENPDTSDSDSCRDKKLALDGEKSTKSPRSKQHATSPRKALRRKVNLGNKNASVEVPEDESSKKSSLDSDKDSKKTSQPLLSSMSPKNNLKSVVSEETTLFTDCFALEKEKVGKELDLFPAKSSKESQSNAFQEGDKKDSFEGDSSSVCKDDTSNDKSKGDKSTEEFLESVEIPPLSPLSSDELVDSFILCCEGDNDSWSPMKPKKDSDKGNSSKLPEDLKASTIKTSETSPPGEDRASGNALPAECEGSQPHEGVKDIFFNLVQGRRQFFSNNQSDYNPGDKEVLKCVLRRLHKQCYRNEDMDYLIEVLNDEAKNFKSKYVAKYLVRLLRKEDEDDVQHPAVRGAPRLSGMQLRILTLILALERRCPRFSDLIDIILKGISYLLFRLGHAPEVEVIMPLARMFTVICKIRKDLQTARTFCYDALFCLGLKAYALIFIVLSIWPEVFRKQDSGRVAGPLESSILMALMELRVSKKKGEIKVAPVQNILKNSYNFQPQSMKSDDLIKKLMMEMKEGKTMEGAEAATILLCKKKGWDWTHGNLLCQNLVSILEDYERGKISVNAAAGAVRLIGFISRSCSMETAGPVRPIVDYLYEAMKNQEKYPMAIQEAIAHSLICLSRFYIHRVAHALDIWTPPIVPSEELVRRMTNLVRNPHKGFWRRHFGQWRKKPKMPKDALVSCRPGVYYTEGDVNKILENGGEESIDMEEESDIEGEQEEDGEGNEEYLKREDGLKDKAGKAGHLGGKMRYRGGWKGSQARAVRRNARWVGMLQRQSSWIKAEERKWDEIAWVKKVNVPSAGRRDSDKLMSYEGDIFS